MGYIVEFNTVLKLPENFEISHIKKGDTIHIEKSGEHLLALHNPIEFCDSSYRYVGKVMIERLTLEKNRTIIDAKVLEVFSKDVADVFTNAFIKQ